MRYRRMPIEVESPEEIGYSAIRCNLAESSVSDTFINLRELDIPPFPLAYTDHRGYLPLRMLIAEQYGLEPEDILITPGAAAALFIVATVFLNPGGKVLVEFPNYATNLETPFAIGAEIMTLDCSMETDFFPDFDALEKKLSTGCDLLSITHPHNPSGRMYSNTQLAKLIDLAERTNTPLLVDETYRDLSHGPKTVVAAKASESAITISSVSKAYGLPGLRIGWIACRNAAWKEQFLAAKEQIVICNSILDEQLALWYMERKPSLLLEKRTASLRNFSLLKEWLPEQSWLNMVEPAGGVVALGKMSEAIDTKQFYERLYREHKTLVGAGHWFGLSDSYFRLGYGWPTEPEFRDGLKALSATAASCL